LLVEWSFSKEATFIVLVYQNVALRVVFLSHELKLFAPDGNQIYVYSKRHKESSKFMVPGLKDAFFTYLGAYIEDENITYNSVAK